MSNVIQHYSFNNTVDNLRSIKLNTDIDELNNIQNEERRGECSILSCDDAASVEISELARSMYNSRCAQDGNKAAEADYKKTQSNDNTYDEAAYEGLSNVEREQKELEDYIAMHKDDYSVDLMRKDSLVSEAVISTYNLDDEELIKAEKEYTEALSEAANGFADFSMKITYGDYSSNDVSEKDLNFDKIDNMEDIYQSYKKQIEETYEGSERTKYLSKLDDVYNSVFTEKIINPIKSAYDDKLIFFQPDSKETTSTMQGVFGSMELFREYLSNYMTNQAINSQQYSVLADGTKAFYDMADDTSLWHDSSAIKNIINNSMNVYSSVKEITSVSSEYLSAKEAADKIAKNISDKYEQSLENKVGIKREEDDKWSEFFSNSVKTSQSGMISVNFSFDKLIELSNENLSAIYSAKVSE